MAKKLLDIDGVKALVRALEPYLGGDSTIEVLPFEECRAISSVNTSTLTATKYMVYYNTTTNRFVAINASGVISSSPTYYDNWTDATPYKDENGRNAPTKGKLYVDAQGRVYAAVGGKLREIREPWMFSSYSSGTAAPDGFVTYAKAGDPVMLGGDSTLRRAGFVLYRTSSFIYIMGATYQGIYIYYVSTSTGKLSTSSSNVFSSYATTRTVTNLTTRVSTLETKLGDIDTILDNIIG